MGIAAKTSLPVSYAGSVMVLALVIGGGTAQGTWSDHLVELALLPSLFAGLARIDATRLTPAARLLALLILLLLLVQFVPVFRPSPLPDLEPALAGWALFSPAPQKSLEAALFGVSILGFTLFIARFSDVDQERCIDFLIFGLCINVVAGALQLSYGRRSLTEIGLPHALQAGLFANENHFASLIYVMIPILAYRMLGRARRPLLFSCATLAMLFVLFAAGSRAGTAIATTLAIVSALRFAPDGLTRAGRITLLVLAGLVVAVAAWQLHFGPAIDDGLRPEFYRTTLKAISDHWLAGTGLGSFTMVYPGYQDMDRIASVYANHAHNDYLEIWLETGMAGLVPIALFGWLACRRFRRSGLAEAAFIAAAALMLHSLVDYPLRTFALAVPFGWFAAVILSAGGPASGDSPLPETPGDVRSGTAAPPARETRAGGRPLPRCKESDRSRHRLPAL